MMLRIGSGSYNPNNYNVKNNKMAQSQPVFGAKISIDDVLKQARKIETTESDSEAQRLLDFLTVDIRDTAKTAGQKFMSAIKIEAEKLKKTGKTEEDADVAQLLETLSKTKI